MSAVTIESSSATTGRKRSRFKRIVISQHNYLALKELGHAGDSFNDVISKLLRIERSYQEKGSNRKNNTRALMITAAIVVVNFFFLRPPRVFLLRHRIRSSWMNLLGCYGGRKEENAAWTSIKQVSKKATSKKSFLKMSTLSTLSTLNLWQ